MRSYFNINRFKKRGNSIMSNYNNIFFRTNKVLPLGCFLLPRRFIRFFRRRFKKFFKRKRLKFSLFLYYNFIVCYKGKNPRMGKGIGFFTRKAIIVKQDNPVFYFKRYNYLRSISFCKFLRKKTHGSSYVFKDTWYF